MYAKLAVVAVLVAAVMSSSLRKDEDKNFLCGPCKDVFKGLKHALPEGVPITKVL